MLSLFGDNDIVNKNTDLKKSRYGSFIDNMKLPIHRWFRYSAGFSAEWVKYLLTNEKCKIVLDPFAGSGTVNIAADEIGIDSIGFEAQPFIVRIARAKTFWDIDQKDFILICKEFLSLSMKCDFDDSLLKHKLLNRCFDSKTLKRLLQMRSTWKLISKGIDDKLSSLLFLAITAILRPSSHAGTAQWQYIQPNKFTMPIDPDTALKSQFANMVDDIQIMKKISDKSRSIIYCSDVRSQGELDNNSVDLVITSPPYANNYDYADATRFEMTFWGVVTDWSDLHEKIRKHLICSSSQHAAKENFNIDDKLSSALLRPICDEISNKCKELSIIRLTKGGKKHYHTMIASYFYDMARVIHNLRDLIKVNGKVFIVIGDSAPYGVYIPVDEWFGKIALDAGFKSWNFEKIRDRNTKWKNRKHNVPLKEGVMCIEN